MVKSKAQIKVRLDGEAFGGFYGQCSYCYGQFIAGDLKIKLCTTKFSNRHNDLEMHQVCAKKLADNINKFG